MQVQAISQSGLSLVKVTSQTLDKFLRQHAEVKATQESLDYNPKLLMAQSTRAYSITKGNKRIWNQLTHKGFQLIAESSTVQEVSEPYVVLSKEMDGNGVRQLAQITFYPNKLICKCYAGT